MKRFLLILSVSFVLAACATPTSDLSSVPYQRYPIVADNFTKLQKGMSLEQVRSIMGKPDRKGTVSDVWYVNGEAFNQLKVLYVDGKAVRATWLAPSQDAHYIHFK